MSVRWQHCIDHADKYSKPTDSPDCLPGVVPKPTDSRLSETMGAMAPSVSTIHGCARDRGDRK